MKKQKGETHTEERAEPRTTTEKVSGAKSPTDTDPAPPKPKYEFKILPVDPKNNFDFEDVADK